MIRRVSSLLLVLSSALPFACGGDSSGGKVASDATSTSDTRTDATTTGDVTAGTDATTSTGPDIVRLDTTTGNDTSTGACEGVTLTGELAWFEDSAPEEDYVAYTLGDVEDLGFGGPLPDVLFVEFYADVDQAGTWNLGSAGENDNYETCIQCVTVLVDIDDAAQEYASDLFQVSGTLTVAAGGNPSSQTITLTLTNLKLEEVTIDDEFVSTPVAGGACYDVASPLTLSTAR